MVRNTKGTAEAPRLRLGEQSFLFEVGCWMFGARISNEEKANSEQRTTNIEHRMGRKESWRSQAQFRVFVFIILK
jgi:hypothetical protein